MDLQIEPDTGMARRYRLSGEIDLSNAPELLEALQPVAGEGGDLALDLSGLSFLDSSGIRVLLTLAAALGDRGRLLLIAPGTAVANTLELVGIGQAPNIEIQSAEE